MSDAKLVLRNNTDARITGAMHVLLCGFAEGKFPLPPAYFSPFTVELVQVGQQTHIVINWAGQRSLP